jgi:peptidoglycan/LPS O-acetylase OafA/YrhL
VVYALTRYTVSTGSSVSRPYAALLVLPFLVLLVLGAVTLDVDSVPSWLAARPMLRLGEWSFALYLVHKPIFFLTEQWRWWNQATGAVGDVIGFCGFCALVVAAAAALYYGVERPLERALRRLPDGISPILALAPRMVTGAFRGSRMESSDCLPSLEVASEELIACASQRRTTSST